MFSMFDTVDPESDHHWNEKVKMAWKLFDKNGDGRLTQLEFRWMTDKKLLTNNKIKLMFSKCDIDGDGALDFEEFKEMILRNRYFVFDNAIVIIVAQLWITCNFP